LNTISSLRSSVVPDVAGTAHRTDDAVIGHQPLELFAGVLATTIGMRRPDMQVPIELAVESTDDNGKKLRSNKAADGFSSCVKDLLEAEQERLK
jgi:hypothetical protein